LRLNRGARRQQQRDKSGKSDAHIYRIGAAPKWRLANLMYCCQS
jgi:hypothetical protein